MSAQFNLEDTVWYLKGHKAVEGTIDAVMEGQSTTSGGTETHYNYRVIENGGTDFDIASRINIEPEHDLFTTKQLLLESL